MAEQGDWLKDFHKSMRDMRVCIEELRELAKALKFSGLDGVADNIRIPTEFIADAQEIAEHAVGQGIHEEYQTARQSTLNTLGAALAMAKLHKAEEQD